MVHIIFSISIFKGDTIDIENMRSVTRCDVAVGRAPNKGARKGVGRVIVLFAIVAVASAVAVVIGSTTTYDKNRWENVNVWTFDVVCLTRLGVQCRQFDPVSGPFSMNNERKSEGSVYSVGSQNHLVPIRSRKTFFKKRSQISNSSLIILYILVGALFITVVVLAVLYARKNMMEICDSEDCVRIAASLKESMNESVDPCNDFYQYACGRWPQEHPIPDSSLTNSWFSERSGRMYRKIRDLLKVNMSASEVPWAVMQAKTLFTSCLNLYTMNEQSMNDLSPLFDLLKLLNLPMVPFVTNKTTNYIEQLASVKRTLGYDIFFGFEVIPDPRNKSKNILYFHLPIRSNPFLTDQELEKRLQTIRSRLRKLDELDDEAMLSEDEDAEFTYMADVIKYVINNGTDDKCTSDESVYEDEELEEFVKGVYNISNLFYYMVRADRNHSISIENLSDSDYMLIDDLQQLTDDYIIDSNLSLTPTPIWRPFIESIFEGIVKLDLDNNDKVLVGNLEYLKDAALLLACFEEEALGIYIWWTIVDLVVPHSTERLRDIWNKYVRKVTDVEVIGESKSLVCASVVNKLMGMAVSWLFVDPTFHDNKINKVEEMLEDIREAFASLVAKTSWMDQSTKTATLKKSKKMEYEIGFPTWLFDEEMLDEYYEGIDLTETKYLANMVQIVQVHLNNTWASLHDYNMFNESYWATDPTDVNAFHTFQLNHITIPAGILQFPFYELGLEALNYGAIGTILGHELTHGFDTNGRLYDSDGNLRLWCESYTAKSLKWMMEDSHCPGHVRLRAVLRNSKEFSSAWNCPAGSTMNPSKKCRLW
ncbi:Endothelin-converting enzyme 1 [Cyphomyrmex costatus]|uniref:Endothelin-converting enzyme 1 n=1 Tax=Cyphomyrmex costatus TaxID=456900 RepID=A0A195CNQ7_9HYME|nr:Endothelin-converting enzyme 1 [Cyphomyrmex costatus]